MDAKIALEGNFITFFEEVNENGFTKSGFYPHNECIRKDTILEYGICDIERGNCSIIMIITSVNKLTMQYSTRDSGNRAFDILRDIMKK
jgi:hypothetical protein